VKAFRPALRLVTDWLRQGLTPHQIALTLAIGLCLSVPPVLGTTTILCAFAGILLRLNQPLIQAVNFVSYPLQLLLLVPFLRAGEWLFGAPHTPLSPARILAMARADLPGTMTALWSVSWHGAVVWALLSPPAALAIYLVARPAIERIAARARGPAVAAPLADPAPRALDV
jgi:uncharacterized protein (DUF2062 family)